MILHVEGRNIAWTSIEAVTRAGEPVRNPKPDSFVHGATFTFVCGPSRLIRGVVRDRETGKPIAGVWVGEPKSSWRKTVTDKEGRYELNGLAKQPKHTLLVKPSDGQYLHRWIECQDTPGFDPVTCDVEMVRGLTVRGKVTDKAAGKPIAGATVDYHPLAFNPHADKLLPGVWGPRSETHTAPDGSYSLTALPGPGAIGVKAPKVGAYMPAAVPLQERNAFFKTPLFDNEQEELLSGYVGDNCLGGVWLGRYNAIVLLEPGEKESALVQDASLVRPQERKGRVVGPDGQPLYGVTVYGLAWFAIDTLKGDEFTVPAINPKAKRPLVFLHKEKKLGYYLKDLRDEAAGPLTGKLQPCGSASERVIDGVGQRVGGLRLDVHGQTLPVAGEASGGDQAVTTDKEGRFRVEGLVPGQDYAVEEPGDNPGCPRVHGEVMARSGEHKDMGDLKRSEWRE